jgi:hypothetical protein
MQEEEDKELKQLKGNYQTTFNTKEGEQTLADLESAYYRRGSFLKDPYETAYREGQRSVIIRIKNLMKEDKNG